MDGGGLARASAGTPALPMPMWSHGDVLLKEFLVRCLQALTAGDRRAFADFLHSQPAPSAASMCSGSEAPILAIASIQAACAEVFGFRWECAHAFSAEINPGKRRFLQMMYGDRIPLLFGDCTEMQAEGLDFLSHRWTEVPAATYFFAGFPCQNVSQLSCEATQHREAFKGDMSGVPKTGRVFKNGVCNYLRMHGENMRAFVLENVMGLNAGPKPTPLDCCLRDLRDLGYWCVACRCSPTDFGFPIDRPRVWIIGMQQKALDDSGVDPAMLERLVQSSLDSWASCRVSGLTFEHTLLPDDHPHVQKIIETCKGMPNVVYTRPLKIQRQKKHQPWHEAHLCLARAEGNEAWYESGIPSSDIQDLYPTLRMLTPREFDMLHLRYAAKYPEKQRRILDLSQSMNRQQKGRADVGATLTPNGRYFLTDKLRLVDGVECCLQQGLHWGPHTVSMLARFKSGHLSELAGNAFHTWVCAAMTLTAQRLGSFLRVHTLHSLPSPSSDAVLLAKPAEQAPEDANSNADALDMFWG